MNKKKSPMNQEATYPPTLELRDVETQILKTETHIPDILLSQRSLAQQSDHMDLTLIVRVNCPHFCNLTGTKVLLQSSLGEEREIELSEFNGVENETAEFTVSTGFLADVYSWTATYSNDRSDGQSIEHAEVSSTFSFEYHPHSVSLAVWGAPFPVIAADDITLTVGAKCNNNCSLVGSALRILDEQNEVVASGVLGLGAPEDSSALYKTEVTFEAPDDKCMHKYIVQVEGSDVHQEAKAEFSFLTAAKPEYELSVTVLDRDTEAPIESAVVSLHPYTARTDARGRASIAMAATKGEMRVRAENYEEELRYLIVTGNTDITLMLTEKPENLGDF